MLTGGPIGWLKVATADTCVATGESPGGLKELASE